MGSVLVLGASGLAGRAIFHRLSKNYSVYGTYHTPKAGFKTEEKMFFLDIDSTDMLKNLLERLRPEVIISSLRGDFEKQLLLHQKAAEYMAKQSGGKLIYLSTANVFDNRLSTPHYEQDETNAESDYGKFKISCETMLRGILGEKCVILRFPEIYGHNCPRISKLKENIENKRTIHTWANLYVNYTLDIQIAKYVEHIIHNHLTGIFHIGSTDVYDYARFQKELAERLHLGIPDFEVETLPQKQYQAVLTARKDIPAELSLSVSDIMDYLAGQKVE